MKSQSKFDRFIIFGKRKSKAFFKSLEPSRLKGRISGPKVLVNSIPKAGTNLLDKVLYNMPEMRFSGKRTLRPPVFSDNQMLKIIKNTGNGEYHLGHIQNNKEILKCIDEKDIKSFIMIRDPRQVLVSHYKYVTKIDTAHPSHHYFKKLGSDDKRKEAVINGVEGIVEPINEVLNQYESWLNHGNTMIVRFEDIIGDRGGGDDQKQFESVKAISRHIGLQLSNERIRDIAGKIYSTKSPTFRSGKLEGWESEFNEPQKDLLKTKIGDWLIDYGYEEDKNW